MAGIDTLSINIQADASKATSAIDTLISKLGSLSSALNGLSNVHSLSTLTQSISELSSSMAQFKQSGVNKSDFTRLATGISTLANVNTGNLTNIGNSVVSLGNSLNSLQVNNTATVSAISNLASSMARLGSVNTSQFTANVPVTVRAMNTLVTSINGLQKISYDTTPITSFVNALAKLGSRNISVAPARIRELTSAIVQMMNELQKAPVVSEQVVRMTEAIANIGRGSNQTSRATGTLTTSLHSLSSGMNRAKKSTQTLAVAFGKFYANCWLLIRGIKGLWKAITNSMDTIETFNYFQASMQQIGDKAVQEMGLAGTESAEEFAKEYAKEYEKQALDLTKKMSGYIVDAQGNLQRGNEVNLGINPNMLMNYQAQFAQLASSMGVASEYAIKTQQAMSEIGADLASVKNLDFSDVYDNLSSALVGMSRAVDKFGVNIRNTALQERLADLGIDASITKLGQADKALLRSIVILDSTRYAWADLADTLDQPANQLRMLKASWDNLSRSIGGIFLSAINAVLPYINAVLIALEKLAQYIMRIFGITLPSVTSQASSGLGDLADYIEDDADAMDDASASAKKLKNHLLGIDELNVLNDNNGSSSASSVADVTDQLQDAFDKMYEEYQKAWDEAYKNVTNKAQELADGIVNAFKKGDWEGIGEFIADKLKNALKSIDWSSIKSSAEKFGKNVAEFLNGLLDPELFYDIGTSWAEWINTKFTFIANFVKTFDWVNAGFTFASAVNGFVTSLDVELMAHAISDGIKGALKMVATFLQKTDFFEIGQKIGTFLKELDWVGILKGIAEVMLSAISALFSTFSGIFNASPLAGVICTGLAGAFTFTKVAPAINALVSLFGGTKAESKFGGVGGKIGGYIIAGITTAIAGFGLGEWIASRFYGEEWLLSNNWDMVADYFFGNSDGFSNIIQQKYAEARSEFVKLKGAFNDLGLDADGIYNSKEAVILLTDAMHQLGESSKFKAFDWNNEAERQGLVRTIETTMGIDQATKNYLVTLVRGYDTLSDYDKMLLEQEFRIGEVTDAQIANAKAQEQNAETERKAQRTRQNAIEATKNALKEYAHEQETATKMANLQENALERAQKAQEATRDAVSNYIEEQQRALGITKQATGEYDGLANSLAEMGLSSDELAGYINVLSTQDIPELTATVTTMSDTLNEKLPVVTNSFKTMSESVKGYLKSIKNFWDMQFAPMFKGESIADMLKDVEPTFTTVFNNVATSIISIVNRMIDAINNAMDVSWDDIEIDGEKVVSGGSARILNIPRIQGFAMGGFPDKGLFMMNEGSSAEMVGNINGKTAVVNNDQIVQAVSNGVSNAVNSAMIPYLSQIADNTKETALKDMSVNIGDREIARANVRGQRSMGRTLISVT